MSLERGVMVSPDYVKRQVESLEGVESATVATESSMGYVDVTISDPIARGRVLDALGEDLTLDTPPSDVDLRIKCGRTRVGIERT